jgi:hypothetical protein
VDLVDHVPRDFVALSSRRRAGELASLSAVASREPIAGLREGLLTASTQLPATSSPNPSHRPRVVTPFLARDLIVLDGVAALVEDDVGVLGVVHATQPRKAAPL